MLAVVGDDSPVLNPRRAEVLADAMHRYAQIPTAHCAKCGSPVFIHKASKLASILFT